MQNLNTLKIKYSQSAAVAVADNITSDMKGEKKVENESTKSKVKVNYVSVCQKLILK